MMQDTTLFLKRFRINTAVLSCQICLTLFSVSDESDSLVRMGSMEDRRGVRSERPGLYPPPFLGPAPPTDILAQVSHCSTLFVARTGLIQYSHQGY